jgi:hypothetical protein
LRRSAARASFMVCSVVAIQFWEFSSLTEVLEGIPSSRTQKDTSRRHKEKRNRQQH